MCIDTCKGLFWFFVIPSILILFVTSWQYFGWGALILVVAVVSFVLYSFFSRRYDNITNSSVDINIDTDERTVEMMDND